MHVLAARVFGLLVRAYASWRWSAESVTDSPIAGTRADVLARAWRVSPQVALRPEPFGALAYHYGTRRLSFLRSRKLLDVVRSLEQYETAGEACRANGVTDEQLGSYGTALATLAESGM